MIISTEPMLHNTGIEGDLPTLFCGSNSPTTGGTEFDLCAPGTIYIEIHPATQTADLWFKPAAGQPWENKTTPGAADEPDTTDGVTVEAVGEDEAPPKKPTRRRRKKE